jgi:phosphoglycolate phosphatase
VTKVDAENIIVIDHHRVAQNNSFQGTVQPQLGSCSTLIWKLLNQQDFSWKNHKDLGTALYYGLYTDTNFLKEISHPLDKDMRDSIIRDEYLIKRLQNSNLSLDELKIAGNALACYINNHKLKYAIFKAEPCDPNILGYIGDLALEADGIDVCVVYNRQPYGIKFSVRSCVRETMANEFAAYITTDKNGNNDGGGNIFKAAGVVRFDLAEEKGVDIDDYIEIFTKKYFEDYEVLDPENHSLPMEAMPKYIKKKIPVGFAVSADIFPAGTPLLIRALEGDEEITASADKYIMIGIEHEVYATDRAKFQRSYKILTEEYREDFEYPPSVINKATGEALSIVRFAQYCEPTGTVYIHAQAARRNTKVLSKWTPGYMAAKVGDYIAVRSDDPSDVYVIRRDIFARTYEEVREG